MDVVIDKRNHKHCPKCNSTNLYFKLNPLPSIEELYLICANCDSIIKAKRESDKQEFKDMRKEFR